MDEKTDFLALNALSSIKDSSGQYDYEIDREAVRAYFLNYVNVHTRFFHDLEEKRDYLIENEYWDPAVFSKYLWEDVKDLFKFAYSFKYRFTSLLGAMKFYTNYALRSDDGETILERLEDRTVMVALTIARGDINFARDLVDDMMKDVLQPATPTFQNAGKVRRGEYVSCFLIDVQDSLDGIQYSWSAGAQLSKLGGGVGIQVSNIREAGAPLKKKQGLSRGVVRWLKIYEDIFNTVDQLGTRRGSCVAWINIHHPDVFEVLDSKRENADELIRLKNTSIGVVVTDAFLKCAAQGKDYYCFSPYDILNEYGVRLSETDITKMYDELVENPRIHKKAFNARWALQQLAEVQAESGYPFIQFADVVNKENPAYGWIGMSNLCSEISQPQEPSKFNERTGMIEEVGMDISCNLASLNVVKVMQHGNFEKTVDTAIRALTAVSELTNIERVPTVARGNRENHSVGLGVMGFAAFLAQNKIHYGDEDSLEFARIFGMLMNYYSLQTSHQLAVEHGEKFYKFEETKYADGSYFDKFKAMEFTPRRPRVVKLFENIGVQIPTPEDWEELKNKVMQDGLYNSYRLAIAPTGSISYIRSTSSCLEPIKQKIEIRNEGTVGRVAYPAPGINADNEAYYHTAYELGYEPIIAVTSEFQKSIDQSISQTLFFKEKSTTRDLNKALLMARKHGCKSIYYWRFTADTNIAGRDLNQVECEACSI